MTAAASEPAFSSPPEPPVNLPPANEVRSEAAADEQKGVDNLIKAAMAGSVVLVVAVLANLIWENGDYADYLAMLAALLLGGPIVYGAAKSMWTGRCSHDHGSGEACGHDHDQAAGGSHMEELVALAILASFALGEYLECALVAFFMLIASLIEHRTAVGALRDIESLVRITPTRAMRLRDGHEEEVAASELKTGDIVVVRPGDNVPADGTIRAGESSINQANITGESLPVEKQPGDTAYAGTINQTGRLEIEVTRAGEDSTLGKVKNLILQASQTRPAVVRELSKYTAYYTPVVLMLAAILFVLTENPKAAISLLLVACPCALILCGPTAVVASLSAASRLGIYVKSVADLEVVRRTTAFVMDKTGTLTTGELAVTKMRPAEGVDPAELLRLAATAEKDSRHPVARAVVAMAKKASVEPAEVTRFAEEAGRGVSVTLAAGPDGQGASEVHVGREAFLNDAGVDASGLDMSGSEGLSLLYVARDGQAVGWVGMADSLRPGAAQAILDLDAEGVKQRVMITGDRRSSAERVASQLALTGFSAEALPGDKLTLVEQLKAAGHTVAVIGDGVNDGPALAAGHVSIAMGAAGSDVAVDAATIALMNNELNRLPFLVRLSRKTVNVIRQNLVFTGVYIVFMLVLLGLGYLTPLWAAIGHGVSSIVVIFNSARLVREGEGMEVATPGRLNDEAPKKRIVTERVNPAAGDAASAVPA